VEYVQGIHGDTYRHPVKGIKKALCRDNAAIPSVNQLDSSVNRPDEEEQRADAKAEDHQLHFGVHRWWRAVEGRSGRMGSRVDRRNCLTPGAIDAIANHDLRGQKTVNGDSSHLKHDAHKHNMPSLFCTLVIMGGC